MHNLHYIITVILIIIWAVCFFVFKAGPRIHLLAVLAVTSALHSLIKESDAVYINKYQTWKTQDEV